MGIRGKVGTVAGMETRGGQAAGAGGWAAQDAFIAGRGWRESRSAYRCIRQVAGRRCLAGSRRCAPGCASVAPQILDHARLCTTGEGVRVLIAEPYDTGADWQRENIAVLRAVAAGLGLTVEERPELSVWFPPYTSMLVIRPEGSQVHEARGRLV